MRYVVLPLWMPLALLLSLQSNACATVRTGLQVHPVGFEGDGHELMPGTMMRSLNLKLWLFDDQIGSIAMQQHQATTRPL